MRSIALASIITASVVAGLAMPALADDVAQCKQAGYKPGTALFLAMFKALRAATSAGTTAGTSAGPGGRGRGTVGR